MRLSRVGELAVVDEIRTLFAGRGRGVVLGIGDDAAVVLPGPGKMLLTTDMMLEGVHFDTRLITPHQLGFKLVSSNVSDIYAMGGRPMFALLGIALNGRTDRAFLEGLLAGARQALDTYGASLVGGDLSSAIGPAALSATLVGSALRPVMRSGAKPGDAIYVTGPLGDSACGLELLKRIGRRVDFDRHMRGPLGWKVMEPLFRRHLMPVARDPGPFLRHATSMIDVSDGLFVDLSRLCAEGGVGARIFEADIPVSGEARAAAAFLGLDPLSLAASGGEDFELLFTAPPVRRPRGAYRIGEVVGSSLNIVGMDGKESELLPKGYLHWS